MQYKIRCWRNREGVFTRTSQDGKNGVWTRAGLGYSVEKEKEGKWQVLGSGSLRCDPLLEASTQLLTPLTFMHPYFSASSPTNSSLSG